jgi:hypothetical protein
MRSPSGQQISGSFSKRISGTPLDGTYEATMTLPAYSEQGTWALAEWGGLQLADKAGNRAYVNSATLAAAGHPTTIEVVRTGS